MIEAIVGLILAVLGLGGGLFLQSQKNKAQKKKISRLNSEKSAAVQDRDEVIKVHNDQQAIQEEANEQKKELEQAEDSSLVDRANNLFK